MDGTILQTLGSGNPAHVRVHLVGAAGSGMRALGDVLRGLGVSVTGSDLCAADRNSSGIRPHSESNIQPELDQVVFSDAVPLDNCERRRARELGIPQRSYSEAVAELGATRETLAVAGSHGKSTVTAMTAAILHAAGGDPTVICGASPVGWPSGGKAGSDGTLLLEACEFRQNFLRYRPQLAALLNIELDHFDSYPSLEALEAAFAQFVAQAERIVYRADCSTARRVARGTDGESFALVGPADWKAEECVAQRGRYQFTLAHRGRPIGRVTLSVAGRHNVVNALAAAALARGGGVDDAALLAGLNKFSGVRRRMEISQIGPGICWIDDFAHHPTEVRATLATARQICPTGQIWCVFQPHQHSRTRRLLDEFAASLDGCDRLLMCPIYRARELPSPGEITARHLATAAKNRRDGVEPVRELPALADRLIAAIEQCELTQNDLIITMGAGNVGQLAATVARQTATVPVGAGG